MLAFVKAWWNNSIVATATEKEASLKLLQGNGLALAPIKQAKETNTIMAYKDSLKPWAVVRQGENLQWIIIARYKSRSDADGHLLLLRQRVSNIEFKVVFDLPDYK